MRKEISFHVSEEMEILHLNFKEIIIDNLYLRNIYAQLVAIDNYDKVYKQYYKLSIPFEAKTGILS